MPANPFQPSIGFKLIFMLSAAAAMLFNAHAMTLPEPEKLQAITGQSPIQITVIEPHLSRPDHSVRITYKAFPVAQVLDRLLGKNWRIDPDKDVEFRAKDGFVSRIPVHKFLHHQAYLAFARTDQSDFSVSNYQQNEKLVSLAPFYLVWDNIGKSDLIADGGIDWPYQVASVDIKVSQRLALQPPQLGPGFDQPVRWVQKQCLSCHRINGVGGDKFPINLAKRVKSMEKQHFVEWVLYPSKIKPGTTMPGLSEGLTLEERQNMALGLHEYLLRLPVLPP